MGTRIGIIAGSGAFALQAVESAKALGYVCFVAGIRGEALPELKFEAEEFEWVGPAEPAKLAAFFKNQDVRKVVFVGKVEPKAIYRADAQDQISAGLLGELKDRSPANLLEALVRYLGSQGLEVTDPNFLYKPFFCAEGVLSTTVPTGRVLDDVAFGWGLARQIADREIGQTLLVKDKAVVAVEAMEGTDETIRRAGRVAGKGLTAIKVGRTNQDRRIDVPAVGLDTLRNLVKVGAAALCFEADKVLFFQREASLAIADANGISVFAKKG
jgi:DUF1009 family protein